MNLIYINTVLMFYCIIFTHTHTTELISNILALRAAIGNTSFIIFVFLLLHH